MIEEKIMKKKYFDGFVFLPLHIYRRHPTPPIWKLCLIPNLPLIQSLKCSTFPLEWWANSERSVNEQWMHAERTLSERRVNDVWTLNTSCWRICERWTRVNTNGAQTQVQYEPWTHDERTMNILFGKSQVFSLHCT